ncbi:MAG TPA: calcium/proton exchanger [Anaerolineales bacterium]|nr:calcium/proton exchanger [Anaerolineales bacterium]
MSQFYQFISRKPLTLLVLALPLALIAEISHWGELWVFIFSALSVIPLAEYIGEGTEALTAYTSPRIGGLLNATLGNAAELIIAIIAIREGLLELVKASITGSILGNLLLVMGLAMVYGGVRHGLQTFDRKNATRNAILLVLAVVALVIPSILSHYIGEPTATNTRVETLSLGVAAVMIILYGLALMYSFRSEGAPLSHKPAEEIIHKPGWSVRTALIVLGLATAGIVLASELLVGAVEPVVESLGVSEFFLGIILIPIVGNVAEHLVAVEVAGRNMMDLSVEIAIASSLQIALFVAPVLVFISLLLGHPLQLIFNQFELLALIVGVVITALVSADGESNWLEGVELLAVYLILGLAFFLLPTIPG